MRAGSAMPSTSVVSAWGVLDMTVQDPRLLGPRLSNPLHEAVLALGKGPCLSSSLEELRAVVNLVQEVEGQGCLC
eukprot:3304835-Pyramimonas_sp.AAC.1